jgi:hypothetical protein
MQSSRHESYLIVAIIAIILSACGGQRQPRAYGGVGELTSDDSMTIKMGQWDLLKYHSDKLGLDINYPSFLYHQDLPHEYGQEVFMSDEMSISVMVDSLKGTHRPASQLMLAMGADLVEVGDDYSIQEGSDEDFDYYGKVLEQDTTRLVTVLLRYKPEHSEAVEPMREWVRNFQLK